MISVVVPFAGDCPHRARSWEWLRGQFDGFEVVEGHADPAAWCKAEAVADALTRASGDLLVIHDADVWTDDLHRAIEAVETEEARWASPHRKVRRLTEAGTTAFLNGERDTAEVEESHTAHFGGGIVVLKREMYERVPLDRRFVGWGQEDDAWACALNMLAGAPFIGTGHVWHLWHPPQPRQSRAVGSPESKALMHRYRKARSPELMRALLDEVSDGVEQVPSR